MYNPWGFDSPRSYGEMTEWFKVDALKAFEVKASVGSNPTLAVGKKVYFFIIVL